MVQPVTCQQDERISKKYFHLLSLFTVKCGQIGKAQFNYGQGLINTPVRLGG